VRHQNSTHTALLDEWLVDVTKKEMNSLNTCSQAVRARGQLRLQRWWVKTDAFPDD